jgi:hypothetical protein
MGHAGAIVSGGAGTAQEKMARFERAGVPVAKVPSEIPSLVATALAGWKKKPRLKVLLGGKRGGKTATVSKRPASKRVKKAATKATPRKSTKAKAAAKRPAKAAKRPAKAAKKRPAARHPAPKRAATRKQARKKARR